MNTDRYLGFEYEDRGRGPHRFDCFGIYRHIMWCERGIELPSYDDRYATANDGVSVDALIASELRFWQPVSEPQLYDLLIFRVAGNESHCGMALDANEFIHCFSGLGVAIESRHSRRWKNRGAGIYRYLHPA